jgi:hypothetical protein
MAFKLIESVQDPWRMVNARHLIALVRARDFRQRKARPKTWRAGLARSRLKDLDPQVLTIARLALDMGLRG